MWDTLKRVRASLRAAYGTDEHARREADGEKAPRGGEIRSMEEVAGKLDKLEESTDRLIETLRKPTLTVDAALREWSRRSHRERRDVS